MNHNTPERVQQKNLVRKDSQQKTIVKFNVMSLHTDPDKNN